jgi:hypothetical protein
MALGKVYVTAAGHRLTAAGHLVYIGEMVARRTELVKPLIFRSRREAAIASALYSRAATVTSLNQPLSAAAGSEAVLVQPFLAREGVLVALTQPLRVATVIIRHVCLHHELVAQSRAGWDVWATNLDTGAETRLGFVAEATMALTGVVLADGHYLVRMRPQGQFWSGYRDDQSWLVAIEGGEVAIPLPLVQNLTYQFRAEDTLLTWNWLATHITFDPSDFGVWTSEVGPPETTGAPDYTVGAYGVGRYSAAIAQGDTPLWVAVRARRGGALGPVGRLELPAPPPLLASPPNQLAWM